MRKLHIICAVITVFLFFFGCFFPFAVHSEAQKVIRVAGDNNFPPFEYLSDSGIYTGFNVDIMNAISIETGIRFEYYPMPWNEAVQAMRSGRVDAIQGMKYNQEREEIYDFSAPYFTSSQGIFVLKDNMYIRKIEDLKGRKVAVQKGDVASGLLSKVDRLQLVETNNQQEAVQLLIDGKVDAFIGNRITGQYFLQKNEQQSLIKIVGESLDTTNYAVAVMPKNKELLTLFNQAISQIKKDGTYEKIEKKWFGEYILPNTKRLRKTMLYLEIGLFITFIVISLILWWNLSLKREVAKRTEQIEHVNKDLEEKMLLLEENIHFQQQVLNSAYSSLITLNQQGLVSMINVRAMDYLELDGNVVRKPFQDLPITCFIPEKEIKAALERKRVFLQKETVWSQNTSKKRYITYSVYPIQTIGGESVGAVLNFFDITEQKQLERKVAQDDRLRSLGQLVAGIAHEIRNPLTSILTYTQLLPKKFASADFRTFFSEQVTSEITRLNTLINDLLDYSRPKKSEPVTFSLNETIEGIELLLKPKIKEKNLRIVRELAGEIQTTADTQQIKQVLVNVILNAIQASNIGETLIFRAYYRDMFTVVEIEDEGIGISEEDIDKIFEPFYTRKPNGVGLGLSISYQLVKENDGTIETRSEVGKGTVVTICLQH
ncbi:transporter substrate-binding domain-containing protein [Bacillus sp. ISL-4]|uniref:transporter substrate-binding domain-containing protein n=1 Tax=Bacillus sp. ISL-4 TaxID=2819125 RepID=UPI001BE70501|nr:transporter substrate-binding domain-containing protein [Bacillus sp. ISL-4]MBT2667598.1 transporter substrate-binding domain-containing protein [Bacillus sp. ISL-4]MBT2672370.1 transporter substrate-binding domain-containing protein [Streptomyces sp. ISL-14]